MLKANLVCRLVYMNIKTNLLQINLPTIIWICLGVNHITFQSKKLVSKGTENTNFSDVVMIFR